MLKTTAAITTISICRQKQSSHPAQSQIIMDGKVFNQMKTHSVQSIKLCVPFFSVEKLKSHIKHLFVSQYSNVCAFKMSNVKRVHFQ